MPQRNLTWLVFATVVSLICHREAQQNRFAGMLSESIDKISRFYVEPVEGRALFEGAMRGMLDELDPYSGYIAPDDYNQFRAEIEQQFGGIGIEVGIQNDRITILNPVPGTPAYQAGLMAGDTIVSIDGENVIGYSLDDAVKLMRGLEGTMVRVEVLHHGQSTPKLYELRRARIEIESIRGDSRDRRGRWSFVLEEHPNIAYIRVNSFGDRTATEVQSALQGVAGKVNGLIMDLRGNAGGLLNSAVEMCDMFIGPDQVVVTTRGRDADRTRSYESSRPPLVRPDLPMVVLVDRYSASASEIFAACLQDYNRAHIVGERTWGKGTVQNVIEVDGGKSAIRLTTQTYWRPSGKNIHRHRGDDEDASWGVRPRPENVISFSTEEYQQVFQQRRRRDYAEASALDPAATNTTESSDSDNPQDTTDPDGPSTDSADSSGDEAEAAPVVDRQLQRAIQIIQQSHRTEPQAS